MDKQELLKVMSGCLKTAYDSDMSLNEAIILIDERLFKTGVINKRGQFETECKGH